VVIRADNTQVNLQKTTNATRKEKWYVMLWNKINSWMKDNTEENEDRGNNHHRGGYQIQGQGAIKRAPFGHGWPGSINIREEVILAKNAVAPALIKGPSGYKPGKPSVDEKIVPEAVSQARAADKQARAVHGIKNDSEDVTIHFSSGRRDTSFRTHKRETQNTINKIIFGK